MATVPGEPGAGVDHRVGVRGWVARHPGWSSFAVLLVACACWSLATPLHSSQDGRAHVIRAFSVARGELLGESRGPGSGGATTVHGPAFLRRPAVPCYAFTDRSAACDDTDDGDTRTVRLVAQVGRHPPWYYGVVGLPTLAFESNLGIRLARLLSAVACAALVALAVDTARRRLPGTWAWLGITVAVTPMVLFLAGVVNPNGVEIAAAVLVWVAGAGLVRPPAVAALERIDGEVELDGRGRPDGRPDGSSGGRSDRSTIDRLGVGAVVLALARHLGPLWLALIAAALVAWGGWDRVRSLWGLRRFRAWTATAVAAGAIQMAWVLSVGSFAVNGDADARRTSLLGAIRGSLDGLYEDFQQMIGVFGWFDTLAPVQTYLVWTMVLGGLVILVTMLGSVRAALVVGGVLAACIVVPVALEVSKVDVAGYYWQGRYTLPLAVGVPILAAASVGRAGLSWRRLTLVLGTAMVLAQISAFGQTLRRFTVGADGSSPFLGSEEWSPPVPSVVLLGGFLVVIVGWAILLPVWGHGAARRGAPVAAAPPEHLTPAEHLAPERLASVEHSPASRPGR